MNNNIKQFIAFGVCSVIALALCLALLVVTVNNLESDTSVTENKPIINNTQLESSKEILVAYINNLVSKTNGRFVKTRTYTDVSVDDITVSDSSENQNKDEALLNFAKDKMITTIDSYYTEDFEGSFKNDDSKKRALLLNADIIKKANFSIGQVNESGESIFDDEGKLVDSEFYYITYNIDTENQLFSKKISKMFSVENDSSAKVQFFNAVKENCRINSFIAKPASFVVKAKVNRTNDEIQYINVIRSYAITINANFINNAEFFGEKEFSFLYTVTDTYEYSYAGISFTEDEITIGFDEEQMLNVNAVIDDDSEYNVEFVSSDENIATVDEMGYVKGLKNCDASVTITVKLNYLGETFTDTCIVNVSQE